MSPTILFTAAFTVIYLAVTLFLCRGMRLGIRDVILGGIVCALTLVLASILIPLPTGSTISAGSWIPLMLLSILYSRQLAFVSGWICGILALFLIPVWAPVHWAHILMVHLTSFSCFGYASIFGTDRKWKVLAGVLLASLIRFTGQVLAGVIFFSDNAWSGWGAWAYSLTFHLSSKLPETILTALILLALPLPTLKRAIRDRKKA